MESEEKLTDADRVLQINLYRKDPNSIEYAFEVEAAHEIDDPLHLEQLNVIYEIIGKYREQSEKALIGKVLLDARHSRKAQKHFTDTYGDLPVDPSKVH